MNGKFKAAKFKNTLDHDLYVAVHFNWYLYSSKHPLLIRWPASSVSMHFIQHKAIPAKHERSIDWLRSTLA